MMNKMSHWIKISIRSYILSSMQFRLFRYNVPCGIEGSGED